MVYIAGTHAATAQTYDARTDFSSTQNPNGVWTYGWSAGLAGPLHVYEDLYTKNGAFQWTDNNILALGDPHVGLYPLDVPDSYVPPHSALMHPGSRNQFTHCVWKAPAAGFYDIHASFTSLCTGGPHGYILKNGVLIGDSLLENGTTWACSFNSVSLAAGDTIDAALGVGTNGTFFNDETQFSLTITGNERGETADALREPIPQDSRNALPPESAPRVQTKEGGGFVAGMATSGQTYDATKDFSFTHNPNGAWTYGWSADLAGPLHVYESPFVKEPSLNWGDAAIETGGAPMVAYSPHDVEMGSVPAHALTMHPGPRNEFSHCVWKAPAAGVYDIQGSFTALSIGGPHAYILKNGGSIGDSLLSEGNPWAFNFGSVSMAAGDTVDAVVGVGLGGSYSYDLTQLSLIITKEQGATPESDAASVARQLEGPLRAMIREEVAKALHGAEHSINWFPVDAASSAWQNSGVRAKAGQHILVQAAEGDQWDSGWGPIDAKGYRYQRDPNAGTPLFHTGTANDDWHWGALICAVGESPNELNDPRHEVEIGSKREFTANTDGFVYFICNDTLTLPGGRNGYEDNSGILHVKVTVTDAPNCPTPKAMGPAAFPAASATPAASKPAASPVKGEASPAADGTGQA